MPFLMFYRQLFTSAAGFYNKNQNYLELNENIWN